MKGFLPIVLLSALVAGACGSGDEPAASRSYGPDTIAYVLDTEVSRAQADELDRIIFGTLLDDFADEHDIRATDSDVDDFVEGFRNLSAKQEAEREEREASEDPRMPDFQSEESGDFLREFGEGMIVRWKINSKLYEIYGGRVIFQQFGNEPVDAYRDFLKEKEQDGSFAILDKQYEEGFWDYFLNDSSHMFISDKEGEEAMTTPWWLMEP